MEASLTYSFTWHDKLAHAFLFGSLAFLIVRLLVLFPALKIKIAISAAVVLSVFYAALVEYLQLFIPGRSMSEFDLLAGLIGVFIAVLFAYEKYGKKQA
jgi:VanZ family protein